MSPMRRVRICATAPARRATTSDTTLMKSTRGSTLATRPSSRTVAGTIDGATGSAPPERGGDGSIVDTVRLLLLAGCGRIVFEEHARRATEVQGRDEVRESVGGAAPRRLRQSGERFDELSLRGFRRALGEGAPSRGEA